MIHQLLDPRPPRLDLQLLLLQGQTENEAGGTSLYPKGTRKECIFKL
jgi:hypothetical protein